MEISVIVPVYNTEKYLKKCIDSIINQTVEVSEIILIDDGSTDGSYEICLHYADEYNNIQLIHTENRGVSAARNTAIKMAKGEYITFVDSDDWIDEDTIEILFELLQKENADMSAIMRKSDFVLDGTVAVGKKEEMLLYLLNIKCIEPWGKLYKRKLFDNIKYREGKTNEDLNILPDIVLECEKIVVNKIGKYNYRKRQNSIMEKELNEGAKTICNCCFDGIIKMENMIEDIDYKRKLQKWYYYHILWYFYNVYCNCDNQEGLKNIGKFYKKTWIKFWKNKKIIIKDKLRFSFIALCPKLVKIYNVYMYGER